MGGNQNVAGQDGERGPGYWDCAQMCDYIERTYGKVVRCFIVAPRRVGPSGRLSAWSVWCEVYDPKGDGYPGPARAEYFGAGGAWKTFPAALHAALRNLQERLADRDEATAKQATF